MKTLTETLNDKIRKAEQGPWFPACGGTEKPFRTNTGLLVQYMYQPSTGRHMYINVETDVFLTNNDAVKAGL